MIHWILSALWDSAFAQFGIAGIVLIGAVAAFIWLGNIPGIRHISVAVASVCIVFLFLGPKLYFEGVSHERAKWEAAERAAIERAERARREAEEQIAREQKPTTPDAPAVVSGGRRGFARFLHAGRVRNDRYDRDNH